MVYFTKAMFMEKEIRISKTQFAYQWLFEKIGSAEYGPGFYLNEYRIAQTMKLNRSCVREALNQLLAEGLIEKRDNRRMYVTRIDGDGELGLVEYRAIIEAGAAMIASQRKDGEEVRKLKQLHEDFQYYVSRSFWSYTREVDKQFHLLIVEMSHNQLLIDTYRQMKVKLNLIKRKDFSNLMQDVTVRGHGAILSAIEAGDGQQAYQQVFHHLFDKG
jgi:DNA-binding GntR family transcriptional regulator